MFGSFFIHFAPVILNVSGTEKFRVGLGPEDIFERKGQLVACLVNMEILKISGRLGRWKGAAEWQDQPRACLDEQDRSPGRGAKQLLLPSYAQDSKEPSQGSEGPGQSPGGVLPRLLIPAPCVLWLPHPPYGIHLTRLCDFQNCSGQEGAGQSNSLPKKYKRQLACIMEVAR